MSRNFKIIIIAVLALLVLYFAIVQTGAFRMFRNSTTSNEPNLKLNTIMFTSSLITPEIGDFVAYDYENDIVGKQTRIHRLCAKAKDTLQIIEGIVYVNKINIDKGIDHVHLYQTTQTEYAKIKSEENISDEYYAFVIAEYDVKAMLPDSVAKKYGLASKIIIEEESTIDSVIREVYKADWNKDNFGPVVVPEGKIFVLGDNRDNSEDSRYLGFINETAIIGVALKN
ncbi:Signal peptidase I [compost metagenome]